MEDYLHHSNEWLQFQEAENNLVLKRKLFFSIDHNIQISDLKKALLGNPNDILFAINVLETIDINYKQLLDILLEISIDGNEITLNHVKNLISKYKDNSKEEIMLFVLNFLDSSGENYLNYQNIAQLFYELGYKNELQLFLNNYCKGSKDEDILELLTDYDE